jgi:tight adherence protein C
MPALPIEFLLLGAIACFSLVFLALGLRGASMEARLQRRLSLLADTAGSAARPAGSRLGTIGRILVMGEKDRQEIQQGLRSAGFYDPEAVIVFGALRLGVVVLAMAATALFLWSIGSLTGTARFYPFAAGGVVFIFAKMALRWRASVRLRRIRAELPFALDVLLLMLESGISLDQCFRSMAQGDGRAAPLVQEATRALVEDIQRGMAYDAGLERWADRLGVTGVRELAEMFRQTLLYGTELGPALREFVREFADKRVSTARESIGRKTTQMTVVMIIFLMPALFIVLAAPAVVSILKALSGLGK